MTLDRGVGVRVSRRRWWALGLALVAVVAVACGGDGGNDEANAAQEAALSTIGVTAETGPEAGYLTAVGEAIEDRKSVV